MLTASPRVPEMLHTKNLGPQLFGNSLGINITSALDSNGTNSSPKHNGKIDAAPALKIGSSKDSGADPFPKIAADSMNFNPVAEKSGSEGQSCKSDSDCFPHGSCLNHEGQHLCFCYETGTFCTGSRTSDSTTSKHDGVIHPDKIRNIFNRQTTASPGQTDDQSTVVNIVVPLGLIVFLGVIISMICLRRQRKHRLRPKRSAETMVKSSDGVMLLDRMNNINKNPSYFTSLHDHNDDLMKPRKFLAPEICMDHIALVDVVGEGAFGQVYRGELFWPESNSKQLVAVKVLKENVSHEIREDFEREVEIMSSFDHDNILKLVGVVTQNAGQSPYMIFEYMVHGDLAELLRTGDPSCLHQDSSGIVKLQKPDLVDIATQIANGMRYLTSQHFVHRDLATRNCLVGEGLVVKISDFGMSRDIYTCDYYKIGGSRMLPVRWMSPESVKFGRFTSESDVWAYGVVLWEIFSSGRQPYYGHSNEEVVRFLDAGILLQRPEDCPSTIYHIMLGCWKADPRERHSFDKIYKHLQDYHERLVKMAAASLPTTPVASKSELRTETPPTTSSSPDLLSKSPLTESCGLGPKHLLDTLPDPLPDGTKASSLEECSKASSLFPPVEACLSSCSQPLDPVLDMSPKPLEVKDCFDVIFQVKLPPVHSEDEDEGLKNTSQSGSPLLPHAQHAVEDEGIENTSLVSCPTPPPALCDVDEDEGVKNVSCPEPLPDVEMMTTKQPEFPSTTADPVEPVCSLLDLSVVDSGFSSSEQPWNNLDPESAPASLPSDTGLESLSHVVCTDPPEIV